MNVGVAQIDITPDFPVELSGFALRPQPSDGVQDPIFARALYLEHAGERLLWIACDVIAFERDLVERFREYAAAALGMEWRQVLLSATHTHTAPATIHLTAAGTYSDRFVSLLAQKLEVVAQEAVARLEPCEFASAQSPLELAIDRRGTATAHVDPVVWAIGFRRPKSGDYLAVCVNYPMHPVTFGREWRRISADWCGEAARAVSAGLDGNPIVLVSNGAAGNLNPPKVDVGPEVVASYGQRIAEAIVPRLRAAKSNPVYTLAARSVIVPLPMERLDEAGIDQAADERLRNQPSNWILREPIEAAVASWRAAMKQSIASGGGSGGQVPFEIQVVEINTRFIVAVNGEMFSRFTAMLRERTGRDLFVVAYANTAFGYIPTSEAYDEGGYEVETAHFFYNSFRPKRGSLEMLVERAGNLLPGGPIPGTTV